MKCFVPKTPREFREMERLAAYGYSLDEIFVRLIQPFRRSEIITIFDSRYCAVCAQRITFCECMNCGQTLSERWG